MVDKYFVKKAGYDKSSCCKGKIPVTTEFTNNSQHETDQKNLEGRLTMLIKKPSTTDSAKKNDYGSSIRDIKNKIPNTKEV